MFTWALVYLARTKTMEAETYIPFFVAMIADCIAIYYLASGVAGKAL